jgi:hypothetical protein
MDVSNNIIVAIINKRKMERCRFQNSLKNLERQEKKAILTKDQNQQAFLNNTMNKRNEWWKKDKLIRESLKKKLDIHLKRADSINITEKSNDESDSFDVKGENHLILGENAQNEPQEAAIVTQNSSNETQVKKPSEKNDEKLSKSRGSIFDQDNIYLPLRSILKKADSEPIGQSVEIKRKNSGDQTALRRLSDSSRVSLPPINNQENSLNIIKEEDSQAVVEATTGVELPQIVSQSTNKSSMYDQNRRKTLVFIQNQRSDEKEQLNNIFNRFYHHTPRYVESKTVYEFVRRKKHLSDKNIRIGREISQKKDDRYENLLHSLCTIKSPEEKHEILSYL